MDVVDIQGQDALRLCELAHYKSGSRHLQPLLFEIQLVDRLIRPIGQDSLCNNVVVENVASR